MLKEYIFWRQDLEQKNLILSSTILVELFKFDGFLSDKNCILYSKISNHASAMQVDLLTSFTQLSSVKKKLAVSR